MPWLLAIPVAAYCAVLAAAYVFQGALLFRPEGTLPDAAAAGVPGLQAVHVRTADGLDLAAWFLPPPPGQPTVLYLHGNGGTIAGRTGRAQRIARRGWGMMLLEYRGYGGNPGTPTEDGLAADARGAMDALAAQGIAASRIVLYGESLGTGVAVRLASERPVGAVVLDSPYTSIADMAQRLYWFLPARLLTRNRFDTLSRITGIHAPLLVIQGARDTLIPTGMGQAVFDAALPPKQLWTSPDGVHETVLETGGEAVMAAFLVRYMPSYMPK